MAADIKSAARQASRVVRAIDKAQQSHSWLAIGVATWKKFGDDQGGNLAALVAYYAFASIFPMLLVAYTILELLAKGSPAVAERLTKALQDYPVVGQLGKGRGLSETGIALGVGIVLTLFGSRGVANAIQNAMNTVWGVPRYERPRYPKNLLRSLGLLAVLGPGEVIAIALSTIAGGTGHLGGVGAKVAAVAVSLLLNVGLFWLGFRISTAKHVPGRNLWLGAILSAIAWQVLLTAGGTLIGRAHSSSAYGTFGTVLGLLAALYLQAQITLYVVELDVVRAHRLWPRSLVPPPLTGADLRAYEAHAKADQFRPELEVRVTEIPKPAEPPAPETAPRRPTDRPSA
jgi:YihY family inner membrane protein